MKALSSLIAVALVATGGMASAQTASPAVTKALAAPARADAQGDDAKRKAAEVLAFSGVKPGDTVVDFLPGAKYYWTRIFSGIVGPKGHVDAMWPAAMSERAIKTMPAFNAIMTKNMRFVATSTNLPASTRPVDLFWTVQNYHDLANKGAGEPALRAFDAAVFRMLKKGGTYVVIDHADAAGTGLAGTETRHRIDPAMVRSQVEAAGFRFVGQTRVLSNPSDDHSKPVFDPAIRGKTDQFVYKFRKP
ncbi:class I SAM-dependent methyltransferase [Sphingomonas ginsenosidivorax]|uniref:Class I SAM-dependent methyltransferase n=1 Tax=Sphingomonas ginsenosidivorax TaxID=862135 RepID=A0A5C6UHF3_9SPHN|nr:class I SAM-dependent methyltransferase [Sphingomonas ginsenosidivorax]TXC72109.1 class I SAM-dependent methyltransferase [Sphingomonas ginsenosidivorax]